MVDDLVLTTRSVEKNKTSIKSRPNPFLQPTENDLSPHARPKWFLTSLPLQRWKQRAGCVGGQIDRITMTTALFSSTHFLSPDRLDLSLRYAQWKR